MILSTTNDSEVFALNEERYVHCTDIISPVISINFEENTWVNLNSFHCNIASTLLSIFSDGDMRMMNFLITTLTSLSCDEELKIILSIFHIFES